MKARIFLSAALGLCLMTVVGLERAAAQVSTTTVSTRQVQRLITRIETKIEVLKDEADRVSNRTGRQDVNATDDLGKYLDELNASVNRLDDSFDARRPYADELREAMSDATVVDQFMAQNRASVSAQAQWRSLKRDFNTLAGYNRLSWNWDQTIPTGPPTGGFPGGGAQTYTVSDTQMETLLSRIKLKTDIFKRQMTTALNMTKINDMDTRTITNYISGFETATDRLKQRFDLRQSTNTDVSDVLMRAAYIDQFMSRNNLTREAGAQWRNLRADLNTLATDYRVSWNWNQTLPPYPGTTENGPVAGRRFDAALTGTYRLNASLSENVSTAVDRALGINATTDQLQRQRLERRLRSPEMIAIEKNNASVAMASSILPRVTFQADGVARSETNQNGRTITTTATADAEGLIINYQGERANDFYITFAPMNDGRLKVTRRVYLENTNDAVTVSSVYDKIDTVARWNVVTTGSDTSAGVVNDTFAIPAGTRLNAVLQNVITSGTNATDRLTLEVTTPSQYRGAIIRGRVVTEESSSRVAGRSRVLVTFDSVRMPNGQTYRFSGVVNGVIAADGENISVAQQTPTRQTRAGVGDVLGALIGAISGRPIEQTAAAGVSGSILTQARDAFNVGVGSQFIITATQDTSSVSQLR
jgi:hypothetical protein